MNSLERLVHENARPIEDCFASLDAQNKTIKTLKKAEIIVGRDRETGNCFLAYGRGLLLAIAAGNEPYKDCAIFAIDLYQRTDQLEMMMAAVQVAKGRHEYQTADDTVAIRELERMFLADSPGEAA